MKLKNLFNSFAAAAIAIMAAVSCQEAPLDDVSDTLTVEPSEALTFAATGNDKVTLKVTTNAESWDFTAPEWIKGLKGKSSLILEVADNTEEIDRFGRITITAGKAAPVKINVSQSALSNEGGEVEGNGPKATLTGGSKTIYTLDQNLQKEVAVKIVLETAAEKEISVSLNFDGKYLGEYNYVNNTNFLLFPEEGVSLDGIKLTVPAGSKESNEVKLTLKGNDKMASGIGYLVPLKAVSSDLSFAKGANHADFILMSGAVSKKEVKNILYFEVNDVNPLCALEYKLEDGTYFFDAVILFAANINYDKTNDVVFLNNNSNVQALLDQTDTYIQPLRKAGLKVYLGLLGNHDAAGLCQLSDFGAREWAKEVALACKQYRLDGVNLDDEYSQDPLANNRWFTTPSKEAGSRLCYELKKALAKECYWPTQVSYFVWGRLSQCTAVTDLETSQIHQPEDFIDFYLPNYNSQAKPYAGLTNANCAAAAFELNKKINLNNANEQNAKAWKEKKFGWLMWYALNSDPNSVLFNGTNSFKYMNAVAKGLYGQEIQQPKGYYKKIGEGKFDSKYYLY